MARPTRRRRTKKRRRKRNVDPGHPEYHRRNLVLDQDTVAEVMTWHGGQGTSLYSLGSLGSSDYVSPSMIDAAIDELEGVENKGLDKQQRKSLDDLIAELDAYARYSEEHTTKEAGLGDVDSGYADWLMEEAAVANPDKRYEPYTDKLNPKWVQSKQGLMLDELYLAKKYAKARADYHNEQQSIHKHWHQEMWLIDVAGKRSPKQMSVVMTFHPSSSRERRLANRLSNP